MLDFETGCTRQWLDAPCLDAPTHGADRPDREPNLCCREIVSALFKHETNLADNKVVERYVRALTPVWRRGSGAGIDRALLFRSGTIFSRGDAPFRMLAVKMPSR